MGQVIVREAAAVLLVADVVAAAQYYRDVLGFTFERFWGEPPRFCILERGEVRLMLNQADAPGHVQTNAQVLEDAWNVYFWVEDARALFEEFRDKGAQIDYEPCPQHYGCLEFGVRDLDGYCLAFGQTLAD